MSRYLILASLLLSFEALALAPISFTQTSVDGKREVFVSIKEKDNGVEVQYSVREGKSFEKKKHFPKDVAQEIERKWEKVKLVVGASKSDVPCVQSITWRVATEKDSKKVFCKSKDVTSKLGEFQQTIQMLML